MRRRQFLLSLALSGPAAWCFPASAQRSGGATIGFLSSFTKAQSEALITSLTEGLADQGLVAGRHIELEYRFADGDYDRLPGLAKDLVDRRVDLIVASGRPAPFAARAATASIPILFVVSFDPERAGLVESLSRPGGNVTGLTHMSDGLVQKRLEVLFELLPRTSSIAMLSNPDSRDGTFEAASARQVLEVRGLGFRAVQARTLAGLDEAFASLAQQPPDALFLAADPFFLSHTDRIAEKSAELRLPAVYPFRDFPTAGGLISYGTNRPQSYRQAALYVSQILRGTKPAELPVIQPTTFELVVNLKAAARLGLTVPLSLLARADEVIE